MLKKCCKNKKYDILTTTSKEEIYKGGEIKTPKKIPDALGDFFVIGTCEEVFACSDLSLSERK